MRQFSSEPVADETIMAALDAARFGPSGGNRQPIRWIVVRDEATKRALGDLYQPLNQRDLDKFSAGGMELVGNSERLTRRAAAFGEHFDEVPVILVACALLDGMHEHMLSGGGGNMIAGSSVYPIAWNACLALRDLGVGTALTTLLTEREEEVAELLELPPNARCACHIAVGYPAEPFPTKLSRLPLDELVFYERFGARH